MINIKEFLGLTYYVSPLDQFLKEFNSTHPEPSASQAKEIAKYKLVHDWRDHSDRPPAKKKFWTNF